MNQALSATEAETWGATYGKQCVSTHNTYPDETTCRGTLERTCTMLGRSFDEPAFEAFFAAARIAANTELARKPMDRNEKIARLAKQAMERGMVRSPGGGMGFLVGSCECPRQFYAYEKECLDAAKRGENAVELTARFFLDHCTKAHEA